MLVLLPPSEGKAASGAARSRRRLDLSTLSLPALTPARERVLDALVALCADSTEEHAGAVLGLSQGQRGELLRNARLRSAVAMPAADVYTGVLYEALDLASLSRPAYRRAERSLLIFSGLWGAVRVGDRIAPYRCSMTVELPGPGRLATFWRHALAEAVTEVAADGPVLDLRSAAYAAVWRPQGRLAERTLAVRVLHERVAGGVARRSVVSHFNKATKGRLVRDLLTAGALPRSPAQLLEALRDLKYTVEEPAGPAGKPRQLDVVVTDL